jgi:hypothetical protein
MYYCQCPYGGMYVRMIDEILQKLTAKGPFGNAPVSVPVYAQYQNNCSVVLVPDFPGIGEQLKLGRVFGRPSGTEACKRPYLPERPCSIAIAPVPQSFVTAHNPPKAKEGFFYFSAASSHRFLFNIVIFVHGFLVVVRRKGDCGEVAIQKKKMMLAG